MNGLSGKLKVRASSCMDYFNNQKFEWKIYTSLLNKHYICQVFACGQAADYIMMMEMSPKIYESAQQQFCYSYSQETLYQRSNNLKDII
jgi:hypothetical protein